MSIQVTDINPATKTAYQILPTNPGDVMIALAALAKLGWPEPKAVPETTDAIWAITLFPPGVNMPPIKLGEYDWIVIDTNGNVDTYNNQEFVNKLTCNVPIAWQCTTSPPSATATSSTTAKIIFPLPTSPNAPWAYTVAQSTDGTTYSPSTLQGAPIVNDGWVEIDVSGLNLASNNYTFEITVEATKYGTTLVSLPTNAVKNPPPQLATSPAAT